MKNEYIFRIEKSQIESHSRKNQSNNRKIKWNSTFHCGTSVRSTFHIAQGHHLLCHIFHDRFGERRIWIATSILVSFQLYFDSLEFNAMHMNWSMICMLHVDCQGIHLIGKIHLDFWFASPYNTKWFCIRFACWHVSFRLHWEPSYSPFQWSKIWNVNWFQSMKWPREKRHGLALPRSCTIFWRFTRT